MSKIVKYLFGVFKRLFFFLMILLYAPVICVSLILSMLLCVPRFIFFGTDLIDSFDLYENYIVGNRLSNWIFDGLENK